MWRFNAIFSHKHQEGNKVCKWLVFALSDDQQFLSFRNWSKSCQIPQKHLPALPQVVIVGFGQGGWSNQQIGRLLSWEKYRTWVVVWGTMTRALQTQIEPKRWWGTDLHGPRRAWISSSVGSRVGRRLEPFSNCRELLNSTENFHTLGRCRSLENTTGIEHLS